MRTFALAGALALSLHGPCSRRSDTTSAAPKPDATFQLAVNVNQLAPPPEGLTVILDGKPVGDLTEKGARSVPFTGPADTMGVDLAPRLKARVTTSCGKEDFAVRPYYATRAEEVEFREKYATPATRDSMTFFVMVNGPGSATDDAQGRGSRCERRGTPRGVTRFVIIGRTAHASEGVRLDDLPGTSGRLDVLVRCVRAALLVSHGLRRDVIVYLVLLGGSAPRTVRIDGRTAKFIRPDERPLATLLKKTLALAAGEQPSFVEHKPGVAVACAGLEAVIGDLGGAVPFVLEEDGADVRSLGGELARDAAFFIGDHLGFDDETRTRLVATGARAVSVGPLSLHSDDVVTLVSNEIDRRHVVA